MPCHRRLEFGAFYLSKKSGAVHAEDLIYLIALAETKDPEILKDGQESRCAEIFEEYANGGLQVLRDAMNQSGGEYPERDIQELLRELGYLNVQDIEPDVSGISF